MADTMPMASINIPQDLHKKLKRIARKENCSLRVLVAQGLKLILECHTAQTRSDDKLVAAEFIAFLTMDPTHRTRKAMTNKLKN